MTELDRREYPLPGSTGPGRSRALVELLVFGASASVLVIAVVGLTSGLAGLAGVQSTDAGFADPVWDFGSGAATLAVLLAAVALTVRLAGRRSLGSVSSVAGHLRWRWLLRCLAPALVVVGTQLAVLVAADWDWDPSRWPGWRTYGALVAVTVLLVPVQAAAEEYTTRGWLVQTLARWTRSRWAAAAVASAVFVALHGTADPWAVLDLTVFALAMCWLTFRTGGLEAAIVLHTVQNGAYTLVPALQGLPDPAPDEVAGPGLLDVLPTVAVTLAYSWWVARRSRSQVLTT